METIYEQIGGEQALMSVVDDFYDRVLGDPLLRGFFAGANMCRLKGRQVEFFGATLGGPNPYRGGPLLEVHRGLGITEYHFNLVTGHLDDALRAAGVPEDIIDHILEAVAMLWLPPWGWPTASAEQEPVGLS